jgi:hypothetical protein
MKLNSLHISSYMKRSYKIILLISLSLMSFINNLSASPLEIEINHIFKFVQNSDCEFERTGTKHSAEEAKKHMKQKYDYYKSKINSTEEFIEFTATKSVITRIKYLIHCPNDPVIESQKWLLLELKIFREVPNS